MNPEKETRRGVIVTSKYFMTMAFTWILFLFVHSACFASTVVLQWDANTDTNLGGYKVYYQADSTTQPFQGTGATQGATPVDIHNQTTATISGLDPAHPYYFAVTAYNSSGVESVYSNIVSVPELVSPTVSLSYPANNASINGTVSVTAGASDNVGVTKVEFYVNGALQATDTSTPYLYSWNTTSLTAGSYTLMAKAYDAAGNVGQSPNVTVTVVNDITSPTVSVTAPANNTTVSGTTTITASASDAVGVTKVEFYEDGALLSASNVAPYSYSWNTASVANGSHNLTAKAYDAANNIGQSGNITVTVSNSVSDTTAPTVSVTAPANNATVSGTVSATATASDNVGVSKVEFYVNNVLQATDTASPYTLSWNTTSVANGSYTLSAKAYDAANNIGQSSTVAVTVNNPDNTAPTVSITAPANSATVSGTVSATATATDNVGVSKVEFYVNNVLQATDTSSPYTFSWNTTALANGSYTLSTKAYDAANNIGQSSTVTVTVNNSDTAAPTVTAFTLPATSATLTVPVSLFTATDNIGVTNFCVTTTNISTGCSWSGTAPSSVTFGSAGIQTAWAWARDAAGNISAGVSAATTITLAGSSSITIGETGILSGDDSGNGNLLLSQSATLGQTATIQSLSFYVTTASGNLRLGIYDAAGANGGPGNLIASTAEITPLTGWNTANVTTPVSLSAGTYWLAFLPSSSSLHCSHTYITGLTTWNSYTYGAIPSTFPASQNTMAAHWSFYATLVTTDIIAPTISITAPANNATVSGTVSVTATTSDNVGVSKVEFYVNNVLQATDTSSPYTFSWNTTALANGSYTLSAKAYDAVGNFGQSSSTVSVVTVSLVAPSNLTATTASATSIKLSWRDNSNNETGFAVWRSINGAAATLVTTVTRTAALGTATGGTVTYTNTGLAAGNTYAYFVTAVNATGPSIASNTVSVVFAAPAAPSGLAGAAVRINGNTTKDQVTLNWTDNSTNETLFTIQRATNAAFTVGVASYNVAANVITFSQNDTRRTTITTPPSNGYYFRVRATNLLGNSTWTPGLFVTTP